MGVEIPQLREDTAGGRVRYLLIVAPNQPDVGSYLTRSFAGDQKVQVLLDRRRGERRQRVQAREPERRRTDRRKPTGNSGPGSDWFVAIRQKT